jgi:hypothetical protein
VEREREKEKAYELEVTFPNGLICISERICLILMEDKIDKLIENKSIEVIR